MYIRDRDVRYGARGPRRMILSNENTPWTENSKVNMSTIITSPLSFAYTLFLFTKSDFKTTMVPITCLAAASTLPFAPHSLPKLAHIVFWVWLHCLQFDLGNQILNPDEDKLNKADRPLASGRISLPAARRLRWLSVPACLALSACYSGETVYASLGVALLSGMYNELGGHLNWVTRTALLATNLACFEFGACLIAGPNAHVVNKAAALSIFLSTGAYGTTNQATDFKDIEGDKLMRRKTLPIAAPRLARPTLFLLMLSWSIAVSRVWELDTLASVAFNVLGFAIGVRFLVFNDIPADRTSCLLYNMWLSTIHVLPAYCRFLGTRHHWMLDPVFA